MINFFISNLKLHGNVFGYIHYTFMLANFFGLLSFLPFQPLPCLGAGLFQSHVFLLCPLSSSAAIPSGSFYAQSSPCSLAFAPSCLKGLLQPGQGSVLQSKGGPVPLLRLLQGRSKLADFHNFYEFWTSLPASIQALHRRQEGASRQGGWGLETAIQTMKYH